MPRGAASTRARWAAGAAAAIAYAVASHALITRAQDSAWSLALRWVYLAQHAGVLLALAAWFGSTLRPGAEPLISAVARRVQGGLTPDLARYTRRLTAAWTLYFLAVAAASLALFFAGDWVHWSLLANVFTPVSTATFFVGEYLLRYQLHPEFERVSLQQVIRAWRTHGSAASCPARDGSLS